MLTFFKILALAFGIFELSTNIVYLSKSNGIKMAYNQHRELPPTVNTNCMRGKVIIMMIVGLMFIICAASAFFLPYNSKNAITVAFAIYCAYTWIEAIGYKYKMSFALAGLITVLLGLLYFLG